MKIKPSKKKKNIVKWALIVIASYYVITILYFGHGDIDSKTGISTFYWSGLDDLGRKDKASGFLVNEYYPTFLNGVDGPYIFQNRSYSVSADNKWLEKKVDTTDFIVVETGIREFPRFSLQLRRNYPVEEFDYKMPEKLLAISDIEGNLTGFYSLLVASKVIDPRGNWIFEKGALVLNGDFFDRGNQVTQLLWFIYHLENQAAQKGGKVHFILGNHEIMNLTGNASYNDFKYIEAAKRISSQSDWNKAILYMYSETSELGKWLRSKNIVERIGRNLFVHGGLNKFHLQEKFSIEEMNTIARNHVAKELLSGTVTDKREELITSSINSPYWDRRLNLDWKIRWIYRLKGIDANKTSAKDLNQILKFYGAERIIIGHSVVNDISTGYNNQVVKIDVKHGEELNSGSTKGLLIQNGGYYRIDDMGDRKLLFN
ncbi:metallophosphoesterase [Algoriphagus resistens]|uniref:metallophosphoesterase n=1 Tax=Algoriphagus resistens TaxID=1750590 RepID=UPI000716AE60|nr:metallophosphoesterase [Algoriphagus resistens]